jgi:dihydropteroate synthase
LRLYNNNDNVKTVHAPSLQKMETMNLPDYPIVMGILNVTEDSFFDGGRYRTDAAVLRRAEQILSEGAAIIDIGAVSTRPGAADVSAEEEWSRLQPAIQQILREFPAAVISVDTWRAEVARRSVENGAAIINDISGGTFDAAMPQAVAAAQVPYVMMHTTAKPAQMQLQTVSGDLWEAVFRFFDRQLAVFRAAGASDIILDPGFGFGKTLEQNYQLMNGLEKFQKYQLPLLVGISRKSMIYKFLETNPDGALNGTTILNTIALMKGTDILRVHDVKEAVEAVKIVNQLKIEN